MGHYRLYPALEAAVKSNRGKVGGFSNLYETQFDGIGDFVNIDAVLTALAATTAGTISGYVTPVDATPAAVQSLFAFGLGGSNNNRLECLLRASGQLDVQCTVVGGGGLSWAFNPNANPFSDGVRTHIAVVHNGTAPLIYINGVAVPITFSTPTNKTLWIASFTGVNAFDSGRLGDRYVAAGESSFFGGELDELRIWNAALTAPQITTHYNGGISLAPTLEPLQANLVSAFRMGDGDTLPTLIDVVGGHNGTATGCAIVAI
jgi:hypothetical protein